MSDEIQKLIHGQYPRSVNDRLVRMFNNHVSIRLVLLAEENEVDAKLRFQLLLQLFLICANVPVLFEDAP